MASVDRKASLIGKTVTGGRLNAFKALGGIVPRVSIGNASVREGNNGTRTMRFPVTLSESSVFDVTVNFATANLSARAGYDYRRTRGTVTFPAGVTTQDVRVPVIGDRTREAAESFLVDLSWPLHTNLRDRRAIGTIRNDD